MLVTALSSARTVLLSMRQSKFLAVRSTSIIYELAAAAGVTNVHPLR